MTKSYSEIEKVPQPRISKLVLLQWLDEAPFEIIDAANEFNDCHQVGIPIHNLMQIL